MSLSERADLVARLSLDDKFSRPLGGAQKKLSGFGSALGKVGKTAGIAIGAAATVATAVVVKNVRAGIDSLAELEDATTSVDGALKQVAKGWTTTSSQIAAKANEIEASVQAAFDDKAITNAATTLIRYGKISEANLFPAMEVMTDLAARLGSVEAAGDSLAKALADPTKATRLLRTAGVTLTDAQEKQVKKWVEGGKLAKAQAFLLKEVAKQTKGAAAAMNGPYRDAQLTFNDIVEDAQRALATGLMPVLTEIRKELSEELAKPATLERIKKFGEGLAGGLKSVVGFVKMIPWNEVGEVLKGAATFGQNLANAFMGLPSEAKGLILGLAALNKLSGGAVINVGVDLMKGALGTAFNQFLGKGSPVNPMYVVPIGGMGGPGGVVGAAAGGGLLGKAVNLILPLGIGLAIGQALAPLINPVIVDLQNAIRPKTTQDTTSGVSIKTLAAMKTAAATGGMSPDERQEHNDTQRRLEKIVSSSVASARGLQNAERSSADRIVGAIRGIQRPIVNVSVSQSYTRISYATGTTLSRYAGKLIPTS